MRFRDIILAGNERCRERADECDEPSDRRQVGPIQGSSAIQGSPDRDRGWPSIRSDGTREKEESLVPLAAGEHGRKLDRQAGRQAGNEGTMVAESQARGSSCLFPVGVLNLVRGVIQLRRAVPGDVTWTRVSPVAASRSGGRWWRGTRPLAATSLRYPMTSQLAEARTRPGRCHRDVTTSPVTMPTNERVRRNGDVNTRVAGNLEPWRTISSRRSGFSRKLKEFFEVMVEIGVGQGFWGPTGSRERGSWLQIWVGSFWDEVRVDIHAVKKYHSHFRQWHC